MLAPRFKTIRECAMDIADILETKPNDKVISGLADIRDDVWRLMVLALRHPHDDGPLRRRLGIEGY